MPGKRETDTAMATLNNSLTTEHRIKISEDDITEGMKALKAYIDITPTDFKKLYEIVYAFAKKRILHEILAEDIMVKPVYTVRQTESLYALISFLAAHKISGSPVVDDSGALVGVVSEKDILRKMGYGQDIHLMQLLAAMLEKPVALDTNSGMVKIDKIMTAPALCLNLAETLIDIIKKFDGKAINRLPVVDNNNNVVGIITRANIICTISNLF